MIQHHSKTPFQSTFPQGERHSGVSFPLISYLFQSTFPQGERLQVVGSGGQLNSVSIHVPARGTTLDDGDVLVIDTVSIHVPARGTTTERVETMENKMFQSTFPQGERLHSESTKAWAFEFQSTFPQGERRKPRCLV